MSLLSGVSRRVAGASEILLALLVVTILVIMIAPVPPAVVDWLVALNIGAAATVLFVALFVSDAIRLPSMPTILLLSTLFRLALNVTTTRLILLEADAGRIIRSFGDFVVGGNFVVGAIVFIVLVLIQFIVIAKGSERVAEVAARFTLDAMPGKQMSIDADLRNGLIDEDQARERRQSMDRESKLYGAMDGAMKFVKGDAIAGIVISIINIVGGLIVGITGFGFTAGQALQEFGILTIGDGLVSQIPALLISVSAGLVVTRVAASGDDGTPRVARDMAAQLLENPLSVAVAGTLMLAFAASSPVTGFPPVPFALLGATALVAAEVRRRARATEVAAGEATGGDAASAAEEATTPRAGGFEPPALLLELHVGLREVLGLADEERRRAFVEKLRKLREELSAELGFGVPPVQLGFTSRFLPERGYAVYAFDGLIAKDCLRTDVTWVLAAFDEVTRKIPDCRPARWPGTRWRIAVVRDPAARDAAEAAGFRLVEAEAALLHHLRLAVRQNAAELVTLQEISRLVDTLRERHPSLVQAVIPALFPIQDVAEVLKGLLREQVPVRDLRRILEALARLKLTPAQKTPALVHELVRLEMRKPICSRFAVGKKRLDYYLVAPDVQDQLREEADGRPLAPDERDEIRRAVARAVDPSRHPGTYPVLLVPPELRPTTFALLEGVLPEIAVLSTQEVTTEIIMTFMGTVVFAGEPEPSAVADEAEAPAGR